MTCRAPSQTPSIRRTAAFFSSLLLGLWLPISTLPPAMAQPVPGGPRSIGGPGFGIAGVPFTWNTATPIQYRVDPGPLSATVDNAAAVGRVAGMFGTWAAVPTASLSFTNAGALVATGAYTGGPVANGNAVGNFNALMSSCNSGTQSPVIFDPTGSLFSALGLSSNVIGFANQCALNVSSGKIVSGFLALNGKFQDNVSSNSELTLNLFNQVITHEIGHFLGLDHSQINADVLTRQTQNCDSTEVQALPVMFPVATCQDRVTSGLSPLSPDDTAWISRLYPITSSTPGKTLTNSSYGTITGTVFFSDGVTQVQDVNVIARSTGNPLGLAFSAVSGYLFTDNIGQSVTCGIPTISACNSGGSTFGSRDTHVIGTFDIPVTPGTYTVQAESINASFTGGSSVGPLNVPIPMPGSAPAGQQVSVVAGGTVNVNITLQGTPARFDSFESSELVAPAPQLLWHRRDDLLIPAKRV